MMEYFRFLAKEDLKPLVAWRHSLDDNRGDRALLRRATKADDVLLSPAFAHFLAAMPKSWSEPKQLYNSAFVSAIIARIKNDETSFATSLAKPKLGGSKSAVSELRFMQLQKSKTVDEFFTRLNRSLAIIDRETSIVSVADSILHWLHEHQTCEDKEPKKRLAVRWATDYYQAFKD